MSFNLILNSLFLRNKIFQCVKDIHKLKRDGVPNLDWFSLGCLPSELIRYNFVDRYKRVYYKLLAENNYDAKSELGTLEKWYNQSMSMILKVGNLEALEFIYNLATSKAIFYPAFNEELHDWIKHIDIVKFLHHNANDWFSFNAERVWNASPSGGLEVVKFLHYNRTEPCSKNVMDSAGIYSFQVVKFLSENRTEGCSNKCMYNAAMVGDLETVKFLNEIQAESGPLALLYAAGRGHLEVVKYLVENSTEGCSSETIINAVEGSGSIPLIKYLMEKIPSLSFVDGNRYAFDLAANMGYFDTVKYLHENFPAIPCTQDAMDSAAAYGYLDIVKYLHYNRTEGCTTLAVDKAVDYGHLDVVRFLLENRTEGLPEDPYTLNYIAQSGRFSTFKYLFENLKLEYSDTDIDYLGKYMDGSQLQWFKENVTQQFTDQAYVNAALKGNLSAIKWIHENTTLQFPPNLLDQATGSGNLDLVKYLHENGATATTQAMDSASKLEILSFLYDNRTEGHSSLTYNMLSLRDIDIIKFLNQKSNIVGDRYVRKQNRNLHDYLFILELIKYYNL